MNQQQPGNQQIGPTAAEINTAQVIEVCKAVAGNVEYLRRQRVILQWGEPARQYVYEQLLEAAALFTSTD